jgi:hypothetical protein
LIKVFCHADSLFHIFFGPTFGYHSGGEREVPAHAATPHATALPAHHEADNNFSGSWRDSEIQIQPLYKFERRKELVVVL